MRPILLCAITTRGPLKFHWGDKGHQLPPISFFMGMDGTLGDPTSFRSAGGGNGGRADRHHHGNGNPMQSRRTSPVRKAFSQVAPRAARLRPRQDDRRHDDGAAASLGARPMNTLRRARRRKEASLRKAAALQLRFSQSLACSTKRSYVQRSNAWEWHQPFWHGAKRRKESLYLAACRT